MKIELSSFNSEKDEEYNNKLSIEDDTSKAITEKNKMLHKTDKQLILTPQEQYNHCPNHFFFTKYGIDFCKIGNTLTCYFDEKNNNSPKICIGPHWYLAVITNILISVLLFTMYNCLIDKDVKTYNKAIYFILASFVYFFFNRCALINPGIVQKKNIDVNNMEFCNICQVYYNPEQRVEHCKMCNICVEGMDHHCVWVGKCVGKNNAFSFYAMLVSIGLFYGYIIYLAFFQFSTKVKGDKKK